MGQPVGGVPALSGVFWTTSVLKIKFDKCERSVYISSYCVSKGEAY